MSSCINNYKLSNSQLDDIKYSFRPFFGISAVRMIINKKQFLRSHQLLFECGNNQVVIDKEYSCLFLIDSVKEFNIFEYFLN